MEPGKNNLSGLSKVTVVVSDEELVSRVLAGERALFEVVMRRHNPRVYRTIRAILRDEAEVEDAMQQSYLLAYTHLAEFAGASTFATWLTRIAVNEALGRLRKRARLVSVQDDPEASEDDTMTPVSNSPEDTAAVREAVRILERAIDKLPVMYRSVVVLRDIEQLSTAEAAHALGVSDEAIRIRLHRARLALRETYAEEVDSAATQAFPFFAPRCDRVVAAVMAVINDVGR
jgi:RNA polymerase sigma-70 factor (ECF subfamily)